MQPSPMPTIKWVFPEEKWEKIKEVASVEQFHQLTCSAKEKFGNKVVALIREGQKFYNMIKYAQKVENLFLRPHQKPQREQASRSQRKSSVCKVHDLVVELKYKPEFEMDEKLKKMQAMIERTRQELSNKIENSDLGGYYNNIRIEKKKSYIKSDTFMKKVKIWFLISEPLVKVTQTQVEGQMVSRLTGSLNEEIKIHEHKQLIREVHDSQNKSINLSMQRMYLSWQKLCSLVERTKLKDRESENNENEEIKEQLNILHIYTQFYAEGNEFYISLESNDNIGAESRNVSLSKFMEKVKQIPNLYTIIFIGPNMRMLKSADSEKSKKKKKNEQEQMESNLQLKEIGLRKMSSNIFRSNFKGETKQWHKIINVPILAIGVYDAEKDILRKFFIKNFYFEVFQRKTIVECFENTKAEIKKLSYGSCQNITNCCCMHPNENQPLWSKLGHAIGNATIHKIFKHNDASSLKDSLQNSPEMFWELVNFILDLSPEDRKKKNLFRCVDVKHNAYREKEGDILLFNNKFDFDYLPVSADKEHWEAGELIFDNIEPCKNSRYRPLVMYEIIQQILRYRQFHVLGITGSSKSGKSLFIELVEAYLTSRDSRYICQQFRQWLKHYRNGNSTEIILKFVREVQRKRTQLKGSDHADKDIKLILILGKINYEVKEEFEKFIKVVSEEPTIVEANVLLLCALGQTSEIRNKEIRIYKIPPISDLEMKYFILKDENIQLNYVNHVIILKEIMEAFHKNEESYIKNEIQFSNFCKELNRMINLIFLQRKNPEERKKIISQEILKYMTKTITTLDTMKSERETYWQDIGFLCSFKESFYLSDFNKKIAFTNQDLIEEMKAEGQKGYFCRVFQQKSTPKQKKSYVIQPDLKCQQYFLKYSSEFFDRKVDYFFNFYYLVYCLIKNHPRLKFAKNHGRIFQKLGIFMYDYEPALQQIIDQRHLQQNIVSISSSMSADQAEKDLESTFQLVLERHIYIYIQFLKQINGKKKEVQPAQCQKLLTFIVYSMLLASICHKDLDSVLGEKKVELNNEVEKFIRMNDNTTNCSIFVLLYQISSLVGQWNVEKEQQQAYEESKGNLRRILVILRGYELVKHKYQKIKQELEKVDASKKECKSAIIQLLNDIKAAIGLLEESIRSGGLEEIHRQKHYECILDLIVTKIMIRFEQYNNIEDGEEEGLDEINLSRLQQQLNELLQHIPKCKIMENGEQREAYAYGEQVIQACSLYLRVKINIHTCGDLDIKKMVVSQPQYQELCSYIKQKLNPKTLFKSKKIIALFMKAGCLKVNELNYNFVRMSNIISTFLSRKLSSRNINLLFLNLSVKNFEMVSEEAPQIHYFVLSADCILNKKNNLQIIFEDNQSISAKLIDMKTFSAWLRRIKAKFLILFGSKSNELSKQISESLHKDNICVISLSLNKTHLDLSTYPEAASDESTQINPLEIVNSFIKAENSQRMIELTICCLITLLTREKNMYVTEDNINRIVTQSIGISKKVVESWYHNKPNIEDYLYQMDYQVHIQHHQMQFPQIPLGEMKNLSSQIIATPINFNDDPYYENVGRIGYLEDIIKKLSTSKSCIIEIAGGRKSGKTELLKQIGWFCVTRRIFQLGVFRYDIKELIEKQALDQIESHLKQETSNKQYMLILLDNLEAADISHNVSIFSSFFLHFQKKPVSLIYTVQHEPDEQPKFDSEHQLVNTLLYSSLRDSAKKYDFYSFDINHIDDVQKLCIALINFRNRSSRKYTQILERYFPDLCGLKIRKIKSKQQSKPKEHNELRQKKKVKKIKSYNKLKRIRSEQPSLEMELQNLSQKWTRNKSVHGSAHPMRREPSLQSQNLSEELSEQNQREFMEIEEREDENISEEHTPSIHRRNVSSVSPNKSRSATSDLNSVLQLCAKYKKKIEEENLFRLRPWSQKEIYEQDYLSYDIQQMMQQLEYLSGIKIEVHNPMFFPWVTNSNQQPNEAHGTSS